jgi:hypothetical protein
MNYSKTQIESFVSNSRFQLVDGDTGDIFEYKKLVPFGAYDFSYGLKGSKVSVISWTEYMGYLQQLENEIIEQGFLVASSNASYGMYSFRNVSKNLLISLIARQQSNDIMITIGKINTHLPIKTQNINSVSHAKVSKSFEISLPSLAVEIGGTSARGLVRMN